MLYSSSLPLHPHHTITAGTGDRTTPIQTEIPCNKTPAVRALTNSTNNPAQTLLTNLQHHRTNWKSQSIPSLILINDYFNECPNDRGRIEEHQIGNLPPPWETKHFPFQKLAISKREAILNPPKTRALYDKFLENMPKYSMDYEAQDNVPVCDSLSALQLTTGSKSTKSVLINKILQKQDDIGNSKKRIIKLWIPGHEIHLDIVIMQDQLRVVRQKCDEYFQQRNKLIDQQHQSMQDCVIEKERKDAKPAKSAETEPQARCLRREVVTSVGISVKDPPYNTGELGSNR
ncbi:hypothetical protein OUZ56_012949 [Daphnia magna]|uniref:Uncharacterized protein n=1 Tax=Daphnia magna TaxID=35525 RepID=A0ABQ9Z4I7_9CRUS|nr:hypothetical protein OUZ56_012949 [Daphnia magna]